MLFMCLVLMVLEVVLVVLEVVLQLLLLQLLLLQLRVLLKLPSPPGVGDLHTPSSVPSKLPSRVTFWHHFGSIWGWFRRV